MQCACAELYCNLWPAQLYDNFPHYLINGTIFVTKKKLLNTKCVFWFLSTTFVWKSFFILRRIERDVMKKGNSLHVKCQLFLSDFNETWTSSTQFRKVLKYKISWKSVQWKPSCSMRTDGHYEANSRFSQFLRKRLKKGLPLPSQWLALLQSAGWWRFTYVITT